MNKWSKRKPFVDTRVAPTEPRYWRRSNISDYIRCGLMLPSDPNQEWTYPRTWSGNAYRLIDFAGYEALSGVEITIDLPRQFPLDDSPYEVTYLFYGDSGDSGSIGLQDLFDLENKYVCLQLRLQRGGSWIVKNSDRITYMEGTNLYGTQVTVSKAEIDSLGVGTITVTLKMVEADGMDLGVLQNPKEFSLKYKLLFLISRINPYKLTAFSFFILLIFFIV